MSFKIFYFLFFICHIIIWTLSTWYIYVFKIENFVFQNVHKSFYTYRQKTKFLRNSKKKKKFWWKVLCHDTIHVIKNKHDFLHQLFTNFKSFCFYIVHDFTILFSLSVLFVLSFYSLLSMINIVVNYVCIKYDSYFIEIYWRKINALMRNMENKKPKK